VLVVSQMKTWILQQVEDKKYRSLVDQAEDHKYAAFIKKVRDKTRWFL
jgi:hypothetical protein